MNGTSERQAPVTGQCSRCHQALTDGHHCQISDEQRNSTKTCQRCGGDLRAGPNAYETIIAQAKRIGELESHILQERASRHVSSE